MCLKWVTSPAWKGVFMKHKCSTSSLAQSLCVWLFIWVFLAHFWLPSFTSTDYGAVPAIDYLSAVCFLSLSLSLSHDGKNICRQQEHRHSSLSLSLSHPCDLSGRRRCAQSPALRRLQLMSLCVARANESESWVCFRPERMLTAV